MEGVLQKAKNVWYANIQIKTGGKELYPADAAISGIKILIGLYGGWKISGLVPLQPSRVGLIGTFVGVVILGEKAVEQYKNGDRLEFGLVASAYKSGCFSIVIGFSAALSLRGSVASAQQVQGLLSGISTQQIVTVLPLPVTNFVTTTLGAVAVAATVKNKVKGGGDTED
jgi:hypothetical protein